ncbi:hypothetical protein [Streptomyces sp. NPDC007074]|uniref:hypothetical protein n=1 Tax=Streptomyces sp. NPDC007074 TaxID=3156764 RepID=UPI00340AF480
MLLLVRYDWRDKSLPLAEDPATSPVVLALTKEYHRRVTHMQVTEALPEDEVADGALMQLSGEVMGLRGALGIALGWEVTGFADEAAAEHYRTWVADKASEWSRCRCPRCAAALSGEGL